AHFGRELEPAQRARVAPPALEERQVVQPLELVARALVPGTVRQLPEQGSQHPAPDGPRDAGVPVGVQVAVVAVVTAEQLVTAVAAQHDLHLAPRQPCGGPDAYR